MPYGDDQRVIGFEKDSKL